MATLTISAAEVDLVGAQYVKVEAVDAFRNPISGGFSQETALTDAGTISLDLTANTAGQFYLITVGEREFLISKSGSTQTLTAARTLSPAIQSSQVLYKTADQSVTASTVLVSDTHLTVPIAASEKWVYEFVLYVTSTAATGDLKATIDVPASAAGWAGFEGLTEAATDGTTPLKVIHALDGTGVIVGAINGSTVVKVNAYVANSTNAGSVVLKWAQGTSDAAATTLAAGSYVVARRLA